MEESLGNPRDSLYFKGFHGTIYSRENGRIMRSFRVISRKGVVTMRCPYCQHTDTKVTDSRTTDEGNSIRRRRECINCGRRFTTYEIIEEVPLMVLKKNGRRELFDRGKLLNGLLRSCDKRTVPMSVMEQVVNDVERDIRNEINQEVTTDRIGELVLQQLKDIDQVAYVRFASVYRKFDNIDSFMEELKALKKLDAKKPKRN